MKSIHHLTLLLAVSVSSITATAFAADPLPGAAAQPASYFYTGKPYDDDIGGYVFRYRNYNPAAGRWLTTDPSGYPDGAHNIQYAGNSPLSIFDDSGLSNKKVAWVYWTPAGFAGNPVGLFNINLTNSIKFMNNADSAAGSATHYLDDGDTLKDTVISVNTVAQINALFATYTRIALFAHGGYDGGVYSWGAITPPYNTTADFGANASNIWYGTCSNAFSPNPTTNAQGIDTVGNFVQSVKAKTQDYLRE